ncbi:hypothetical protein ACTXT7_000212 [Hymenolepis weldensis]
MGKLICNLEIKISRSIVQLHNFNKRAEEELNGDREQVAAHLESFKRWTTPMPHLHLALG